MKAARHWYTVAIAIALVLLIPPGPHPASSQARDWPTTAQFMTMLTTCAAGAKTQFQGDILGSVRSIYEGQSTKGFAELKTEADFMRLLPESQKFEGYRLYVECIKSIVNDPAASKAKLQFELLRGYRKDTPIAKVIEVFGQPAKIKALYKDQYNDKGQLIDGGSPVTVSWFEGVNADLFVAANQKGRVYGVGVTGKKEKQIPIPYMSMGNMIRGKQKTYYNIDDFQFGDIGELCQIESIEAGHARFQYVSTSLCYFGAPGGYMNYEFVFQPTDAVFAKCKVNFLEKISLKRISCPTLLSLRPALVFVWFTENILPGDMTDVIMEWMYNFAQ